jgi:hypothetical protein
VIYPQGIHISHSKYLTISDKMQGNSGNLGLYVLIWFYNIEGEFGVFEDIEVDVSHLFFKSVTAIIFYFSFLLYIM